MPVVVEVPDGEIEFPDSMSESEIDDALRKHYPPKEDISPSLSLEELNAPKKEPYYADLPQGDALTGSVVPNIQVVRHPQIAAEGAYNAAVKAMAGMTSPLAAALGPASRIPGVQPIVAGVLGGMGAKGAGEVAGELAGTPDQTTGEKVEKLGDIGVNLAMALAPVAHVLPRSITAAQQALKESEIPNASEISKATEVYGDVRPQPVEGVREVPVEEGGGGVQPQAPAGVQGSPQGEVLLNQPVTPTVTEPPVIQAGAAHISEIPETGEGGDIYGIAERVRAQRAQAGQTVPIDPGQGVSALEAVVHGQDVLAADPLAADKAVEAFGQTKAISYEGLSATRAMAEKAFLDARRIEEKSGTDSPEYEAAKAAAVVWDKASKEMQTEWHKAGQAQQGQTDIDTGSFTGLERAYREVTDRDFPANKIPKATQTAKDVTEANTAAETARRDVFMALDKEFSPRQPSDAEKAAFDAANKTVRENAVRVADLENKLRLADNENDRAEAKVQLKATAKALDAAKQVVRDAAVRAAKEEQRQLSDPAIPVWQKAKEYLAKGVDNFDDIRNKVATDLGIKPDQVTRLLGRTERTKRLIDDLWNKQQEARRLQEQAKRWVTHLNTPGYVKAIQSVPRVLFGLKVGFHGTVALGTHAPFVAFQPKFWKTYVQDFGKMYKMVAKPAYYEMQVQDLLRRPNYLTARRAGLVNDPFTYEDFNSPDMAKYFGNLTGMGNRGYSVLKILRQDMFDQMWNKLPKSTQVPEVAQAIADGLNHATGVVKGKAPRGANIALFAPRLAASRVAWLAVDPIKAADTFLRWNKATPAQRLFAINQVKEKAWVAGTMFGMLAINQGILNATGSNQRINLDDPFRSDFLKFKAAGMDIGYGNAMLSMARLPVQLYRIRSKDGGKLKYLIYPDEDTYTVLGKYARSQLSPFAGLATELWLKADYQNRPLPSSDRPVPKRLAAEGIKRYTWPEFWSEQLTPIPVQEALKEVWGQGMGMKPNQIKQMNKAMATIAVMAGTGARLSDDTRQTK